MSMIPAAKPLIGDEEREAVDRVLRSGMIAQGPEVAAFEQVTLVNESRYVNPCASSNERQADVGRC